MPIRKEANVEPIQGYRLIHLLGKGGCGEVWKCEAPGGLFKAIKFVYGNLNGLDSERGAAEGELKAIDHIKKIRHPFLLSMDRVECVEGELVIITELADTSLDHRLEEYQSAGYPGIPREELLGYLRETAEVLDLLYFQYGLQHLDVKPRNLFLVSKHIKVADFGLVHALNHESGKETSLVSAVTPLYASPELFQKKMSSRCDQYSLAITYQELLTGTLPYEGTNSRQLLMAHANTKPNLEALSPEDQKVVAKAISKDPEERFASCTSFIEALIQCRQKAESKGEENKPAGNSIPVKPADLSDPGTDTDNQFHHLTVTPRPTVYKKPPVTPATKDFNFQECLATTPLLEVWLVETAREEKKVIKFLYGASGPSIKQQQEALMRLQSLDHPAINPVEVLECSPGRITLLTDYIGQSLRDYHKKFLSRNVRGIPRIELLDILRTAAESLDYLYRQHSVQHLGLNPRNLLWTEGRLVIDEFGFLQLIWLPAGQTSTQRNKRYSAPEVFKSKVSPTSDQYSLALIYAELLTGTFPRAKPNSTSGLTINLDLLTPTDREIVARALDSDPNKRWSSCTELIDALEQGDSASAREESNQDEFSIMVQSSLPAAREISLKNSKETSRKLKRILSELIRSGGGSAEPISIDQPPEFSPDRQVLFHRFTAGLPLGEARLKLNSLREELFGQQINDDPQFYVFHVSMPSRFWEQWIGRQPGLEISISLAQHHPLVATPIEVTINIKSFQCNKKRGKELVEEVGTSILEQIRACLLVNSEKRVQERLLWPHPVEVYPVQPNGTFGEKINCRGKDLSLTGIGFYLPHQLETSEIQVYLPATKKTQPVSIAATLVRAKPCVDGWYEVGALFRLTNSRNSTEEICMK